MRIALTLAVLLYAGTASAALNAYLTITAETQGKVEVVSMKRTKVVSPRDAASGIPTGKRQHKAVVVVMELDKASPLLVSLAKGGKLENVRLRVGGAKGENVTLKKGYIAARERKGKKVRVVLHMFGAPGWKKLAAKLRAKPAEFKPAVKPAAKPVRRRRR